jgi:hypothetical protein
VYYLSDLLDKSEREREKEKVNQLNELIWKQVLRFVKTVFNQVNLIKIFMISKYQAQSIDGI